METEVVNLPLPRGDVLVLSRTNVFHRGKVFVVEELQNSWRIMRGDWMVANCLSSYPEAICWIDNHS